jgi:predicted nuclease of predicted toxin-antitoxin system
LKFLGDENLDSQIVERLRLDGHIVWYVIEMQPGISDDDVLNLANTEGAILLTFDKDFGEARLSSWSYYSWCCINSII